MKKGNSLGLLLIIFVLSSCQKEIDWGFIGGSSDDYQPVSANSVWSYSSTSSGNYSIKSLGTDSLINSRRYYKFDRTQSGVASRLYMNITGNEYWQYAFFPQASQVVDLIYLKDSAIGTTWTNTITISGFANYHKYTVSANGSQRTVNGKTFNNVIELDYKFSFVNPIGGGTINAGTGKYYYAKGIGAIESFYTIGYLTINLTDTTRLTSYTIR